MANKELTSMGLRGVEPLTSRLSGPPEETGSASSESESPLISSARTDRGEPGTPVETTSGRTQDVHTSAPARKSQPAALDARAYRRHVLIAYAAARAILELPVMEMLAAIAQAHAVGPFLDPTLYRDRIDALREDEAMLRALAGAKRQLELLPWPARQSSEFITPPAAEPLDDATRVAFGGRP